MGLRTRAPDPQRVARGMPGLEGLGRPAAGVSPRRLVDAAGWPQFPAVERVPLGTFRAQLAGLDAIGQPARALAQEAGLPDDVFDGRDGWLPADRLGRLWELALRRSGDEALVLRVAAAVPPGAYGVLDYLAATARDVTDAFRKLAAYYRIVIPTRELRVEQTEAGALVVTLRWRAGPRPHPLADDFHAGLLRRRFRDAVGGRFRFSEATLRRPAPRDEAPFRRLVADTLAFDAEALRLVVPPDAASLRSPAGNAELHAMFEALAAERLPAPDVTSGIVPRCEIAIREALAGGEVAVEPIARACRVSPRTLQRRLRAEGTSFRRLVDDVRRGQAERFLRSGRTTQAEVAFLLGFSDQSAFLRAFRRWTGTTPTAWTAAAEAGSAPTHVEGGA